MVVSIWEGERLEKSKYTTLENIKFIVWDSWRYDKLVFVYFGLFTVLSAISPFIGILFPKFILDQLIGEKNLQIIMMLILGFFLSSAIIGYLIAYLQAAYYPHMVKMMRFLKMIDVQSMPIS